MKYNNALFDFKCKLWNIQNICHPETADIYLDYCCGKNTINSLISINTEEFMDFLVFVDKYPAEHITIDQIEIEIVDYI